MIFYFHMINAWSLASSILNGTLDEDYPIMDKTKGRWDEDITITSKESDEYDPIKSKDKDLEWIEKSGGFEWTPGSPWPPSVPDDGISPLLEDDGLDYEVKYYDDYMADIDDQRAHHFVHANSAYNDGWTQQFHKEQLEKMDYEPQRAHFYKYHEEKILKDIEEYVSGTYQGHYTGKSHEYRNVQTIDLMASKELAAAFCQANILKYGSRYGNKDGKNKKDLMKVIHYAMLLLHFDNHYGEPSMPSGNFEQMP